MTSERRLAESTHITPVRAKMRLIHLPDNFDRSTTHITILAAGLAAGDVLEL